MARKRSRVKEWSPTEDEVLASRVLEARNKDQHSLCGLNLAGRTLGRTLKECQDRWKEIRDNYPVKTMADAEEEKEVHQKIITKSVDTPKPQEMTLQQVIQFLESYEGDSQLRKEAEENAKYYEKLYHETKKEYDGLLKDYKELAKLVIQASEILAKQPVEGISFKQEKNGNLQRIN